MNKKNIDHEKLWESWYSLRGIHEGLEPKKIAEMKKMGFFSGSLMWYEFDKYGFKDYANDREFCNLHPINGWLSKLIDDKRFISVLFRNKPQLVPELSIGIEDNEIKYILEDGRYAYQKLALGAVLLNYSEKYGSFFIKPAGLSGGRGAFVVDKTTLNQLSNLDKNHAYIVNNRLENDDFSNQINPYNLNTLRGYFFRNEDNNLEFLTVVQRFGTKMSGLVDNVGAGGVACEINLATGEFSKGFAPMLKVVRTDYHPESGIKLTGLKVPNWPDKLNTLYEILDNLSFLDYAAIDVAVTNKGIKLLEVNSLPSRRLIQFNRPAFHNKSFRRFCEKKGYNFLKE